MPRTPLPPLTPEQREAALAKARAARLARAQIKTEVAAGAVSVSEIIERAKTDPALGKMRVLDLLASVPRIGPIRARAIMDEAEIADSRRLRGLGPMQVRALVERFG